MKRILLSTGAALLIGLATVTSAVSAGKLGGDSAGSMSRGPSPMAGGGNSGAGVQSGNAGMRSGNAGVRSGNAGAFSGGNNMSFRGDSRMGRMGHDRDHERFNRFRGPRFAFGFSDSYTDYSYNDGCYQWREVPTRRGWRWLRVWVCN
jgi:hypothetical protein